MVSEKFKEKLTALLQDKLGGATIQFHNVTKNNGICLTGLTIHKQDSNAAPCIYLEKFYSDYGKGDKSIGDIADEVLHLHYENHAMPDFDTAVFTDYSHASAKLRGRLINTEKNMELLKSVPHREFLDLSLIYHVEVLCPDDSQGIGSIRVQNEHLQPWGVTEQDLYRQLMENMEVSDRAAIINMTDIFANMRECLFERIPEESFPMYVLTNQSKLNGAVQILNEKALESAAGLFGSDFFILPSSIHETILVPAEESEDTPENLARMVHEVNETVVLEDEFLSSHVYRYFTQTRQIQFAA